MRYDQGTLFGLGIWVERLFLMFTMPRQALEFYGPPFFASSIASYGDFVFNLIKKH